MWSIQSHGTTSPRGRRDRVAHLIRGREHGQEAVRPMAARQWPVAEPVPYSEPVYALMGQVASSPDCSSHTYSSPDPPTCASPDVVRSLIFPMQNKSLCDSACARCET